MLMSSLMSPPRNPPHSVFPSTPILVRDSPKRDDSPTTDLYISQIPAEVDSATLRHLFSRFGTVDRVFEGRRDHTGRFKWAFVSYLRAEDAQ
jgi:RNA recognition motif-containing protein